MSRVCVAILALVLMPAGASAQEKKDPLAEVLAKLRKPLDVKIDDTIKFTELCELVQDRCGVAVTMNTESFVAHVGDMPANVQIALPKGKGIPLGSMLRQVLAERNLTFLVRKSHLEIVPVTQAAKECRIEFEEDGTVNLPTLVSAIYKEKPLNEALADLAEEHDLTILVSPQTGDGKTASINARLLNVPADRAIELLALQADLRVVRKGNAYLVTSKEHELDLFDESLDRKRQTRELDLLWNFRFNGGLGGAAPPPEK